MNRAVIGVGIALLVTACSDSGDTTAGTSTGGGVGGTGADGGTAGTGVGGATGGSGGTTPSGGSGGAGAAGGSSGANLVLSHDFEDGTFGPFSHGAHGGDQDQTSVSSAEAHGGTQSGLVDYTSPNNLNKIYYEGLQALGIRDEIFVSFWFKHHANWQFHHNHKLMRLTHGVTQFGTNHEFLAMAEFFSHGNLLFHHTTCDASSPNSDFSVPLARTAPGEWHHFEIYCKQNTMDQSDGELRFWIDGESFIDEQSYVWTTAGCDPSVPPNSWNTIWVPDNYADDAPAGSTPLYWIDDIEIYDGLP